MKIDCSLLPVMKANCKTCPFKKKDGVHMQDAILANQVTNRTLFKAHQICHGTEKADRTPTHRCKGSFDFNFEIYDRLGYGDLVAK